ncbi:hypothetical protein OF829_09650 [Sphingomonas sp. LB-2]|uniref:hypothetical protein n=1 Tax=Sphingomonas caeni TaxID=2984949 RepID=UPI00222FEEF7|nr:hypothetical protein [Sphingomonas caeni]MCW3847507.1 hypothetical protein [Sphingomonas caeni]
MAIGNLRGGTSALVLAAATLAGTIVLSACKPDGAGNNSSEDVASNPCIVGPGNLSSALPNSMDASEVGMDCFAWQSFIALNWKADPNNPGYPANVPAADFGLPTDQTPKVWETYLEAATVFGNGLKGQWKVKRPAVKTLTRISKTGDLDLSDVTQAGAGHHWLTNQRGEITYYEVMMNKDEYEFITEQKWDLTTAQGQLTCATQHGKVISDSFPPPTGPLRGGLTLPEGQFPGWDDTDCEGNVKAYGDHVGAMEIKASWTPLPEDGSLNSRYKTAIAMIEDPTTHSMKQVTVGLVGLHIARKRVANHQWVWATFEHIDNSPDEGTNGGVTDPVLPPNPNIVPRTAYTFFGADCDAKTNFYKCVHNAPPTWCAPGAPGCTPSPYDATMQITRLNPVGSVANSVTAWYWSLMPAASVFNYYRLINVQWPQTPGNPIGPKATVPLSMGNPMPKGAAGGTSQILANTTLESFQQTSNACMDCHVFAQIAPLPTPTPTGTPGGSRRLVKPVAGGAPVYSSDYSFLFVTETKR